MKKSWTNRTSSRNPTIKKVKEKYNPHTAWEKIQHIYLIRKLYPKYVKNSYNPVIKRQIVNIKINKLFE